MFNPELRHGRRDILASSKQKCLTEEKMSKEIGKPWGYYDSNATTYFDEHSGFGQLMSLDNIRKEIIERHENGEMVMGIDIMGQAGVCKELGCDYSIGVTLPIPQSLPNREDMLKQKQSEGVSLIEGDVFDKEISQELQQRVSDAQVLGYELAYVFYRPVAGDNGYLKNEYVHKYLVSQIFEPVHNQLVLGGKMFLDLSNFHLEQRKEFVQYIFRTYPGTSIKQSDFDDVFMITKTA